ncbi:MAG: hypothetical protein KUG77_08525 [Nannocystaceae bacterium]|nr:hypothetical protein [Nannocystaceae bacterium]
MPSLPQVLHEASLRGATEVTLESDEHPMVRTDAGSVTVGDPLSESELFDALSMVLGPDQQAELALGNVVSFGVDVGGEHWALHAEPATDGIIVRGRLGTGSSGETESPASSTRGLDLPKLDTAEPDRQSVPATGKSILRPTKRRTQWDIGVPEAPVPPPRAPTPPPSKPSWSQRAADEGGSDFELRTPTGEHPANLVDAHDLSLGEDGGIEDGEVDLAELVIPPPQQEPKELDVRASLEAFAPEVASGTLCIVQGEGGAEALATAMLGGEYALIDDAAPEGVLSAAAELEPGGRFAVRLEDPNLVLGWMLRRLEEGSTVVVQSRARTAPGAQRILLGTSGTRRAEEWLSVHAASWFSEEPGGWSRHDF